MNKFPMRTLNVAHLTQTPASARPRLRSEPIGLADTVLYTHYCDEQTNVGRDDILSAWENSYIISMMRQWPGLLSDLKRDFTLPHAGPQGRRSYIRDGLSDLRDILLCEDRVSPEKWPGLMERMAAKDADLSRLEVNVCDIMTHFRAEVEVTLEEHIRDVLDHLLLSVYIDVDSPWRRSPVAERLASKTKPSLLARCVAAALEYSVEEFDYFRDWANGYIPGRLPHWPQGNWLTSACCRWACRRLDASDVGAKLAYMTDTFPVSYPWYILARPEGG